MEPTILQINSFEAFFGIGSILVTMGIAWGKLNTSVKILQKTLDQEIKPEFKNLRTSLTDLRERYIITEERVEIVWGRMEAIWKDRVALAQSPRQLNKRGMEILENSGIKKIIDEQKNRLLGIIKLQQPTTAYDAERLIEKTVSNLLKDLPSIETELKDGAFTVGADLNEVLYVGSIYLRNEIFPDLDFNLTDLDTKN